MACVHILYILSDFLMDLLFLPLVINFFHLFQASLLGAETVKIVNESILLSL